MADSFSSAVAVGVVPTQGKRPQSVTIEYTDGLKLVFTDQSLRLFWEEFVRNYTLWLQVSSGPMMVSEDLQNAYAQHVKGVSKDSKNDS